MYKVVKRELAKGLKSYSCFSIRNVIHPRYKTHNILVASKSLAKTCIFSGYTVNPASPKLIAMLVAVNHPDSIATYGSQPQYTTALPIFVWHLTWPMASDRLVDLMGTMVFLTQLIVKETINRVSQRSPMKNNKLWIGVAENSLYVQPLLLRTVNHMVNHTTITKTGVDI